MTDFQVQVFQNEYLNVGATEVHGIVTVAASGGPASGATTAAEVIIVDTSGSMGNPVTKMSAAKRATNAAIDALRDGVEFAVVAGNHLARSVYPFAGLATATPQTRAAARNEVQKLHETGGTAMGQWLMHADELLAGSAAALKHVILLTDGKNEHETPEQLAAVLRSVSGRFVGDCRGVGTDWVVAELRSVADALLGTVDIVAEPAALEADFKAMTGAAMAKAVADVVLRVWTPQGAVVKFVKQVEPTLADLTDRRTDGAGPDAGALAPRSGDYPTGSWGTETRDYHVCVQVPAAAVGERMLAARISLVSGSGPDEEVLGSGKMLAVWTDDTALSTRINREVAHYTGQAELAAAIQEGLAARRAGDVETATAKLGRAVALATANGNADTALMLEKVVDVEDPHTGTVHLKRAVTAVDEMTLDTRSSKTMRVRKGGA